MPLRARARALQAAFAGGAALGLTFTLAEVAAGYAWGGRFPFRFWVFLAVYSVPGLALLSLAVEIVRSLRSRASGRWEPGPTLGVLFFVYVAAALNHQLLRAYPFLAPIRLASLVLVAAAAVLVARSLARAGAPHAVLQLAWPPLLLTCATAAAARGLEPLGEGLAALLFVPLVTAGVLAGSIVLGRLVPPDAAPGRATLALVATGLALAFVLIRGLQDPAGARFARHEPQPPPGARGPNVLLIVLDTVRAANLSAYGYPRRTTPHFDAFARQAVRYDHHLAASSWSLPGHASLFTGLLPSRHGADGPRLDDPHPVEVGHPLAPGIETLAGILAARGYATAGISANFAIVGRAFGLDQGFRDYDARPSADFLRLPFPPLLSRVQGRIPERFLPVKQADWFGAANRTADVITDLARTWLDGRRRGQPFLLFLNYMDAHDYAPPPSHRDRWPGRSPRGQDVFRGLGGVVAGAREITREEADHVTALYDGSLSFLDEHLGGLLEAFTRDPEFEDTWVVVTSDHGESLGEHKTLQHQCSLYQEILWTPLVIRYPRAVVGRLGDVVHPGAVDTRLVHATDILPTLLEGSGFPVPEGLDGRSIQSGRESALAESFVNEELAREVPAIGRREITALVEGEWKLIEIRGPGGTRREFYSLRRDPPEWRDLAWAGPADMDRLAADLARSRATATPPVRRPAPPPLTEEQRDVLRAVGYIR